MRSVTVRTRRETSVLCGFSVSNAAARLEGMSYSKLMGALHKAGIEINRKVLADLAMNHPELSRLSLLKQRLHKNS